MAATDPAPVSPVRRLAILGLGALTVVSLLAFFGGWWWLLDLLAHFRVLALLCAMLAAAALAVRRWWKLAAWALALVLLHLALVLPLYSLAMGSPVATDAPRLRVIAFNLHHGNPRVAEAAAHVASLEPDVVAVLEVSREEIAAFAAALPEHRVVDWPRNDAFGIVVLTRIVPTATTVHTFGPDWAPSIELELPLGDRSIALLATHPPPPVGRELAGTRDAMLAAVGEWAAREPGPVVVVGDLNATPWSAPLRALLDDGRLRSTQRFGIQPTWPDFLGPLGLPIDHALSSEELVPIDRRIEPAFGSDHRMLRVDLELRAP
ncbi:endonuclease/exonuclease/phosphatase family protein [Paraliomyxa miuraensis]|uniref:endonuclease/exonuclease/phosphatase family protein n=1 Tax=Paraliomyxa miuraensis TaxID=376150 RepID=UPI00224EA0BF|nr:endonuclease/exonuclease/phosphatase family protein [Paraliomyxa miuraensis]MCX4246727.1 endonuclease/exonuclease/phosphatase family protein [Paraliomyxa miuraensis]